MVDLLYIVCRQLEIGAFSRYVQWPHDLKFSYGSRKLARFAIFQPFCIIVVVIVGIKHVDLHDWDTS